MIDFPKTLLPQYLKLLEIRGVPATSFAECIKWCRYFFDYCDKYLTHLAENSRLLQLPRIRRSIRCCFFIDMV